MDDCIFVKGARENNLNNVDVEIPRDKLTVIAGVSGSGKTSLAFDVIYGEGQRLFMNAFSSGVKRFANFLNKPDVDYISGLSPVVSIQQKTTARNPRSTVGTMTDINDYLHLLYSHIGNAQCPYCHSPVSRRSPEQIAERLLSLPQGVMIEITSPVLAGKTDDMQEMLIEYGSKGYRKIRVDGVLYDTSAGYPATESDSRIELVINTFILSNELHKQLTTSIKHAIHTGEGLIGIHVSGEENLYWNEDFACPKHHILMGRADPGYFTFNNPENACSTCSGLGTELKAEPDMLVRDGRLSIKDGALVSDAFHYDAKSFKTMVMSSLALHYGFSLDTPYRELPPHIKEILFYGTGGEKIKLIPLENAVKPSLYANRLKNKNNESLFAFEGLIHTIERSYRDYKKKGVAAPEADAHYKKIMLEHLCPDCGGAKVKPQRLLIQVGGKNIYEVCKMPVNDILSFVTDIEIRKEDQRIVGQIMGELYKRLGLLEEIGLGYISLNRKSDTLSGGEAQRIRLSAQIGTGLKGIIYVLDEPSIGLHPKDSRKLIGMMRKLREIGNTVIVVEHDEEMILAADHVIEMGPGPGSYGGNIISQGTIEEIRRAEHSLIGRYLNGTSRMELPYARRKNNGRYIQIRGAREHNLQNVDADFPLGTLICVTGVSGSGKSTLIHQVLYQKLHQHFHDPRSSAGLHDSIEGMENITDALCIDQTSIGRSSKSTPVTYTGIFDHIRRLFASTAEAKARGYTESRFSFNQKGGRCEDCGGEGRITSSLHFMPDIETECRTCGGARFNRETLEVTYRNKNIADVLDMPIADALDFFSDHTKIVGKLQWIERLGLGYLKLGQSSTTLSGGEAQRIKLAAELGRKEQGKDKLFILDEPTTGLHPADIKRLLDAIGILIDKGGTVIVIEHNMEFVKMADYVIDMGPGSGREGGKIIAYGTPEQIAERADSPTGEFLKDYLNK